MLRSAVFRYPSGPYRESRARARTGASGPSGPPSSAQNHPLSGAIPQRFRGACGLAPQSYSRSFKAGLGELARTVLPFAPLELDFHETERTCHRDDDSCLPEHGRTAGDCRRKDGPSDAPEGFADSTVRRAGHVEGSFGVSLEGRAGDSERPSSGSGRRCITLRHGDRSGEALPMPGEAGVIEAEILEPNAEHEAQTRLLDATALREVVGRAFHVGARDGGRATLLIALDQDVAYDSPNFRWVCSQYACVEYVDRIIVAAGHCGHGPVRSRNIERFVEAHRVAHALVTCGVNCPRPSPVSDPFHASLGFREVAAARAETARSCATSPLLCDERAGEGPHLTLSREQSVIRRAQLRESECSGL